ncbi:hypothetical protein AKJ44_00505 [candidate division MSBL1 archaeon SCGC-AAA261F17]|uniref:MoaD/ThiS family protein n=1 Tax=candidate division MSBL1 archaeon SCGC-AAA261F17 TaxID=1698274 RepID=A0A133V7L6_9EURY|nr:hypothetical protein AKJ44_00505 [candidate division MSBL1 archaeon SCGC-AAA261F17]
MRVKIINGTHLRDLPLKREWREELPEGGTVEDLLSKLGLSERYFNLDRIEDKSAPYMIILKNKKPVPTSEVELSDGDVIKFIHPFSVS